MPIDREKLKARLRAVFAGEAAEHVAALNRDLLLLEASPDAAERARLVQLLFRTAHTLKGAARSVTATPIERLCHELENVFDQLRKRGEPPAPELLQTFFAVADALDVASKQFLSRGELNEGQDRALRERLAAAARGDALPPLARAAAPAPPAPAPVVAPPEPAREALPEPARETPPEPAREAPPVVAREAPPVVAPADVTAAVTASLGREEAVAVAAPPRIEAAPARAAAPRAVEAPVRLATDTLDALMRHSGEWVVARRQVLPADQLLAGLSERIDALRLAVSRGAGKAARPAEAPSEVDELVVSLTRELERTRGRHRDELAWLDQVSGRLEGAVRSVCLQPFEEATGGLERTVRDVAREQGKEVALVVTGAGTLLDRAVLTRLRPALQHLVRNAVDHGLEAPAQRVAAGKPAGGTVTIGVEMRGAQVDVLVRDDGRGIDRDAVIAKAQQMGVPVPTGENAHLRLVFHAGLSTARTVSEISGRGVGLDAVNAELEAVHGRIDARSTPGAGTQFRLSLPASLSTFRALIVETAGRAFGFVTSNVERLVRVAPEGLPVVFDNPVLIDNGRSLPVVSLTSLLGLAARAAPPGGAWPLVLLAAGDEMVALAVDAVVAEEEIVLKPLGPRLSGVPGVAGAAVLPDGRICLVLTASELIRQARVGAGKPATGRHGALVSRRLIVADDSVTTRQLLRGVLEGAGYTVTEAPDGQAALELLESQGADLVVSDVEMPRMDGLTLTRAIRNAPALKSIPVVLCTGLEKDAERLEGLEAGANAYLKKSAFEQDALLEAIEQLI